MSEEKGVMPNAEKTDPMQLPEISEVTKPQAEQLPDEPASEVEKLKVEYAEIVEQVKKAKEDNEILERRLKDNQEYISRTRNVEKEQEAVRPQKTMDDYLGDLEKIVDTDFENDPKQGLKKALRKVVVDVALDRDFSEKKHAEELAAAEEWAFKKMLALNPETGKALKEIEKLDEECPDLRSLSYERKLEFINLRNSGNIKRGSDMREKINREVNMAGGVGGGGTRSNERVPSWVNDPDVVAMARDKFATKQELLNYADPHKARELYERKVAQQRKG